MEESVSLELQNLSSIALHSTKDCKDLLNSLPGLGFTSRSREDLENQRSSRFIQVWNDLSRKNITHNYDSLEILANLLELRAGDLLGLSARDQMKAVLGSHSMLPLDLLFSPIKRYVDVEEDQWIPCFPKGGEPLRERTLHIELTSAGPLIPSSHFGTGVSDNHNQTEQYCSIMAVEVLNTSGRDWSVTISNFNTEAEKHIWVSLKAAIGRQDYHISDNSDMIFILDTSPSVLHTTTQRGRNGCCLIKKNSSAAGQNTIQTRYVCPLLWGYRVASSRYQEADTVDGKLLGFESPDILINSNVADWLHVEPRQNLFMPSSFAFEVKMALLKVFHALAMPVSIFASALRIPDPSLDMQPWTAITMLLTVEAAFYWIACWIADMCQKRANDYLQLQSFHPDWRADETLLSRLEKALLESDESSPWRTRMTVLVLKCVVWLYVRGV